MPTASPLGGTLERRRRVGGRRDGRVRRCPWRVGGRGRRVVPRVQRALLELLLRGRSGPGPGRCRCPTAGRRRRAAAGCPAVTSTRPTARARCASAPRLTAAHGPRVAGSTPRGPFVHSGVIDRPEASVPAVVRLRSAVCLLGRFPALAGVDLDVAEGEIVLLSGANGAGKTTLLRLLAGLVPLYSGEATVLGHDLAHDRRGARRDLALVGHETFCYDDLTVRENLRFAARAAGRDRAEGRRRARAGRARPARPTSRTAGCRQVSDAGSRWRSRCRAIRGCSSSTNRTPGSTPKAARCSTRSCAPRRPRTAPCCIASHELEHARPLATARSCSPQGRHSSGARGPSRVSGTCDRPAGGRHEPLAGGAAGRGEGPAHRGAVARHAAADRRRSG